MTTSAAASAPTRRTASVDDPVKANLRRVWALGDYPRLAEAVIPRLGAVLVDACDVRAGELVLDIAAGSGNATLPAARAGARVVASDLTPELLERGRALADTAGLEGIEWRVADAEALPFQDAGFDVVLSCVGSMFAPRHTIVADETARVTRPGGRIGMVNWTPEGFVGQLLATLKPYAAPPPAGATPSTRWGEEGYVRELFAGRVSDLELTRQTVSVDTFTSGAAFRDLFKTCYGPIVATYDRIAGDPDATAALDAALAALADAHLARSGTGTMDWEYLLVTGRRADR